MQISSLQTGQAFDTARMASGKAAQQGAALQQAGDDNSELRKAFDSFVGESFYGQLLGSMRKTVGKPAYFHGGRAEEVFRGQLDQLLAGKMSEASASEFTGPMFELFNLNRQQ